MALLLLTLVPLFVLVALLLCGRFIGEERIVRHWASKLPPRRLRRVRPKWSHAHETPLASLLQRSPVRRRGPPALLPHAA